MSLRLLEVTVEAEQVPDLRELLAGPEIEMPSEAEAPRQATRLAVIS